tara:strand:+ start:150030 stop:151370 length:1341 start_codon:yes stop_codon:yes gene_type:complete
MKKLLNMSHKVLETIHPMPQNVLIMRMPIIESKEAELRAILNKINQDPANNELMAFSDFKNVHFARFIILEGPEHPEKYASSLFFIANIDGSIDKLIEDFINNCDRGLDQILSSCQSYPPKNERTASSRYTYITTHIIESQTDYINTLGRKVSTIHQEDELRNALQDFLDTLDITSFQSAKDLRKALIEFVNQNPEISWALATQTKPSLLWRSIENIRFAGLTALGVLILMWGWPILVAWILTLRMRESQDPEDTQRPPLERLNQLRAAEDLAAHNPFAAVGYLKPGLLRRTTARSLLLTAQVVLRHVFNKGDLAGVPLLGLDGVDTIHFAHWTMIDDDQRLLFTSNYDGSLESYMVDFIDKVAWGLNLIFSNGLGYPRTRWIVHDGAKKEQRFKDYLGNHQIENQVWYTAYPHLTAVNIANNEAIHKGLRGHMSEGQAKAWLKRL